MIESKLLIQNSLVKINSSNTGRDGSFCFVEVNLLNKEMSKKSLVIHLQYSTQEVSYRKLGFQEQKKGERWSLGVLGGGWMLYSANSVWATFIVQPFVLLYND